MLDQSRSCCCLMPLTAASPEEGGRAQTYEPSVVAGGPMHWSNQEGGRAQTYDP